MPYYYSDPERAYDPYALPNVEIFESDSVDFGGEGEPYGYGSGWYFAFGFPGCLWDSEPVGPFDTESEALEEAQTE